MNNLELLDPLLLKTGRVAARLGRETLGELVGASAPTIKNLETRREAIDAVRSATLLGILKCFKDRGIELSAVQGPDQTTAYSVSWRVVAASTAPIKSATAKKMKK